MSGVDNDTALTLMSSHESTLLIPESIVWLPYVGLVLAVLVGLGLDFYRFHQKNKVKYACMKEHASVVSRSPKRQRISMISGVGLRFKKGKLVLGDVWNTSPSSSDVSTYSPWREGQGPGYGSRDITPSDDGGPGDDPYLRLPKRDDNASVGSFAPSEYEEEECREPPSWSIGGEKIEGSPRNDRTQDSLHSYGFSVLGSDVDGSSQGKGRSGGSKGQSPAPERHIHTSVVVEHARPARDGDGDPTKRLYTDVGTQTDPVSISYNVDMSGTPPRHTASPRHTSSKSARSQDSSSVRSADLADIDLSSHNNNTKDLLSPPTKYPHGVIAGGSQYSGGGGEHTDSSGGLHPNSHYGLPAHGSHGGKHSRRTMLGGGTSSGSTGGAGSGGGGEAQPTVIDFSPRSLLQRGESSHHSHPSTPRTPRSKFERRRQELQLDFLNSPRSPTTEIVAKDHGFELAGIEVPPSLGGSLGSGGQASGNSGGSGSGSGGGSGGGTMFKAPGMQVQSKSFIRPVMGASGTQSSGGGGSYGYRTDSSSALTEAVVEFGAPSTYHQSRHHHHHQAYRRGHSLSMEQDEDQHHRSGSLTARSGPPSSGGGSRSGGKRSGNSPGGHHMKPPYSARAGSVSPRPRKERRGKSGHSSGRSSEDGDGGSKGGGDVFEEGASTADQRESGGGSERRVEEGLGRFGSRAKAPEHSSTTTIDVESRPGSTGHRDHQTGSPSIHPQLKKIPKDSQHQHHHHHERRDSHRRKLSSQSFSSNSGSRKRGDRPGSASSSADRGSKPLTNPASIPSHLYHEDEEGFFSSQASVAASMRSAVFSGGGGQDQNRKGILFFSRLAGAGRHSGDPGGGGSRKAGGGVYRSGGFES